MAVTYQFDAPDRFVVGVIGEDRDRTYCLQVRKGNRILTLTCEPTQVAALATHLERVLDEIANASMGMVDVPPASDEVADTDPLDLPLDQDFVVGTMAIGWDAAARAVHLELFSEAGGEQAEFDPALSGEEAAAREAERAREMATITLSPGAGRDFIARANAVLAALAPACPLCAQPVQPAGHICPRLNGYRGPGAWSGDEAN